MSTMFQVINKAVKISKEDYPDQIVLVYQRANGDYAYALESEYHGNEENICGKYLCGRLAVDI
jgi:hypothetical protein